MARKLKNRLRRAQGQLAGLERMLDDEAHCVDVLTQLAAVEGAVAKTRALLLAHHVESCVEGALTTGNKSRRGEVARELMAVITAQLGR